MKDMCGTEFKVGQRVVKSNSDGDLRITTVRKIVDDNVYLGKSTNYVIYPENVYIIDNLDL